MIGGDFGGGGVEQEKGHSSGLLESFVGVPSL